MQNITEAFVDYLFEKRVDISDAVRGKAELCLRDYHAVTAAGARKNREKWGHLLEYAPAGKAELFGLDRTTDCKTAALINGFNAHTLELDDGQRFAMIHLAASVISAILAAESDAPMTPVGKQEGIILGYEAACRTAISMQPSHKQMGFHTAGTCGTIGAAVGVAFALGMDQRQLKRVLTVAAGSSAGMLEIQEQNSELKPFNLGHAAMDGLTAAWMGFVDFEPPKDMLGGERGYFNLFSQQFDARKLLGPQSYFEIERTYFKPYASCRHSHSAVEAAIRLHEETNPKQIEDVLVETYRLGVKGHDHWEIQSVASARLSTPYAVAVALLYGSADLTRFEPLDERAAELATRIRVVEQAELTKECPQKRVAVVTVTMKDGSTKSCRVDYARGEPENPMTQAELLKKYRSLSGEINQNLSGGLQ